MVEVVPVVSVAVVFTVSVVFVALVVSALFLQPRTNSMAMIGNAILLMSACFA